MSNAVSYAQWLLEPYSIGLKLRSLRNLKRLTLSRLAVETGLSTALLSKLETDRMIPTLPTLATIAHFYGVGLDYFFREPTHHQLSITRKVQLQGYGRGVDPVQVTPLNSDGKGFRLIVQIVEFPPGGFTVAMNDFKETGAMIYVLEGRLRLETGAMHEVLETGDCACLESEMPLAWSSAGKRPCRILAVLPNAPHVTTKNCAAPKIRGRAQGAGTHR